MFGSSSTFAGKTTAGFGGGAPPTTTGATTGFGGAPPQPSTMGASTGFGGASNAPTSTGFGGATAPTAASGGFGSSTGGAPSSTAATGGFGNATGGTGFGQSPNAASTPFGGNKTTGGGGFGGGGNSTSTGFGSFTPAKTREGGSNGPVTTPSTGFGQSGFGASSSTTTSTPFGPRIPRKERSPSKEKMMGNNNNKDLTWQAGQQARQSPTPSSASEAAGDEQLAALRARIQEKRKKLLKLKQGEQSNEATGGDNSGGATTEVRKDDETSNAELAAKNALRFSTSNTNQTLNKLLPSDLKAQSNTTSDSGGWSTPANSGQSTPVDSGEEDVDEELDVRHLSNARSLVGTCKSMCPDEELVRREREGDIQLLEITDPGGLHPKEWTLRNTAVKRFRRSAADFKLDIPELVRPPEVLEQVCGYLEEWVMERDRQGIDKRYTQSQQPHDIPPPLDVYQFIWDRTRMIRKDFILQNYIGTDGNCDACAVRCHERIARWHAMSEHQLSHIEEFVIHQSQQNIAELGQTMKTLNMYYDDALGRGLKEATNGDGGTNGYAQGCGSDIVMGKSPVDFDNTDLSNTAQSADVSTRIIGANGLKSASHGTAEPEMRGLYILLTLNNEGGMEVLKYSGRLCVQRPAIFYSRPVQLALSIFQAKKDHNYARFFSLLRSPSTPYLYSCIMFKYVENMRKDALTIMSKTYGAKHKTTGAAFYDEYPLENLVNLLCYEDAEEASAACRHYGITVKEQEVLWRHSKFREPRDPEKGHIITLKPRKMMRTIEAKLKGATRLSVCRGGVSGEGATLSETSSGGDTAAAEFDRKKAQEAAEKARKEAMKQRSEAEAKARVLSAKMEKERVKQATLAAEKKARAEAAKRVEMERLEKERVQRERILAEQRQKKEEAQRLVEAKAAAERAERARLENEAREREAARKRAEEEAKERERQRILARQREEEARRSAEIKAANERAEQERREREERHRLAECRRKAEEERVRKVREEEAMRIEMEWQEKIDKARKVLAWRLWRKQMHKHESLDRSRRSLDNLDPTSTHYPAPITEKAPGTANHSFRSGLVITRNDADVNELENQMYRLATASRQPIDLSKMVAECLMKSPTTHDMIYPPTVQSNKNIILFKLVVLLPNRTPGAESFYDTLRMWVNSHLRIGHVSSHIFKKRSQHVEVCAVTVIGNEDPAECKDCNAALVLLPSAAADGVSSRIEFPEEVEELLDDNVSRMVLVLDDERSSGKNQTMENILDHLVGKVEEYGSAGAQQRQGVAAPKICHLDGAFGKCCETVVKSHFESTSDETQITPHIYPSMARASLVNLGFLCLQRLIQNMDAEGCYRTFTSFEDFFSSCEKTLNLMADEISHTSTEVHQKMQNWPPLEFREEGTNSIPMYFDEQHDLPFNWHLPLLDLKRKVFEIFQQLLQKESFAVFVERAAQELSPSLRQNLLTMVDNDEISSCFANVVSLFVNGELSVETDEDSLLYLPIERMSQIIEQAAAYEAPPIPEPVFMELPSYLYQKTTHTEEKENSRSEIIYGTPGIDKIVNKRKPSLDVVEPETPGNERVKRIRSNAPEEETEEQRRSKEFTSLLEALL